MLLPERVKARLPPRTPPKLPPPADVRSAAVTELFVIVPPMPGRMLVEPRTATAWLLPFRSTVAPGALTKSVESPAGPARPATARVLSAPELRLSVPPLTWIAGVAVMTVVGEPAVTTPSPLVIWNWVELRMAATKLLTGMPAPVTRLPTERPAVELTVTTSLSRAV